MKKIFTLFLVFASICVFAQRPAAIPEASFGPQLGSHLKNGPVILMPGVTEFGVTQWENYWWKAGEGYVFGTNTFNDKAYGQHFVNTETYNIVKATYWIGTRVGTTGSVGFKVWDYENGKPAALLYEQWVDFADITASETFAEAYTLTFTTPVVVTRDFVIGVDVSQLNTYEHSTGDGTTGSVVYGMGNISSQDGQGGNLGRAWLLESNNVWKKALDYETDVDIAIFPYVEPADTPSYSVTFNVNMGKEANFDPETHEVWLTGNFVAWADPGSEGAYRLTLKEPVKEQELEMLWPGAWDETVEAVMWTVQDNGGYVNGTNRFDDLAKAQIWKREGETEIHGAYFWFGAKTGATGNVLFRVWKINAGNAVGDILATKTIPLSDITISNEFDEAFYVAFDTPVVVDGDFMVGFDMSQIGTSQIGLFASDDGDGGELLLAREQWDNGTWHDYGAEGWNLDIDMAIFPMVAAESFDDVIYTVTVDEITAGQVEYKYYSTHVGAGWEGGEWTGGANRIFQLRNNTVRNDMWGANNTVSVIEAQPLAQELMLFPNPVRTQLFVNSNQMISQVRVFDLTGRLVLNKQVNDLQASLDVNELNQGIYVMQVMTAAGISSRKFTVVK